MSFYEIVAKHTMASKNRTDPQKKQFTLHAKVVNGAVAGIIGVTSVYPLDLVKKRLPNPKIKSNKGHTFRNMVDCLRKTYRAEGYFGMYRGSAVNILLVTPEKAIKLTANDYFRHRFTKEFGLLPLSFQIFAGGLAGVFQITITTARELLRIQMQNAGLIASQTKCVGKRVSSITATHVIKDRGFGITGVRDVSFSIIFFPLFALLSSLGPRKNDDSGDAVFWCSFLSGCAAGSFAAFAVTPFDVLRNRLGSQSLDGSKEFTGIFDCILKTLRYEGVTTFFRGGVCRMIVIAPLFGISQTVYFLGVGEAIFGIKK